MAGKINKEVKKGQSIKSAEIRDYKGIDHVSIDVGRRRVILIGGKNASGKTSFLDALRTALGGRRIATNPVRSGSSAATIEVELDDIKIHLNITGDGKINPTVIDIDSGRQFTKGKNILRDLFGRFQIDVEAFEGMSAPEQAAVVQRLVTDKKGKPLDFTTLDAKIEKLLDQRRDERRDHRTAEEVLANTPVVENAPTEEVTSQDILDKMADARKANDKRDELKKRVAESKAAVSEATAAIKEMKAAIAQREAALKNAQGSGERAVKALAKAPAEVDEDTLESKLGEVEEKNRQYRAGQTHTKARTDLRTMTITLGKTETALEENRDKRVKMMAEAKVPIKGLAYTEEGVTYNGQPFADCSSAERLRVCFALAVAENPTSPILFIDGGERFDDEQMREIKRLAKGVDAQLFMAVGSRHKTVDLLLADGSSK